MSMMVGDMWKLLSLKHCDSGSIMVLFVFHHLISLPYSTMMLITLSRASNTNSAAG